MTEVEKAAATVADIEFKLADASARATALATERKRHAYDAAVGNAKATKALEAANVASGMIVLDLENLNRAGFAGGCFV